MQPNHRNNSSKQEKRFTGQYLPKLNSLTNATPFPQLLNDINVSLTGFASSTEKWPEYKAGSWDVFSVKRSVHGYRFDIINLSP